MAALYLAVLLALLPGVAHAEDAPEPPTRYFYFWRDYGSEAMYGPLWVFIGETGARFGEA